MRTDSFRIGTRWAYVATAKPLPKGYVPRSLVDISVPQAANRQSFQLVSVARSALIQLFTVAKTAGRPLIVSSAYRSEAYQTDVYASTFANLGEAYATSHVANPGASEHQTGLAVDINSYTLSCTQDANMCKLRADDAAWLARYAPSFGFILRYPQAKESSTGISYEPWHFRYVGKDAQKLTNSGLTLDQFVTLADKQK